jgi:thiamine-phosphate pyrophosphorylase
MGKSPHPPAARPSDPLPLSRLYAIIDPAQAEGRPSAEIAAQLIAAGVRLIQIRDKHAASGELYSSAERIAELVHGAGGVLVVNDRADVARAMDADGVHLGQDDLPVESARALVGPGKMIGYSTHVLEQVREAEQSSADYIAFGPVFATRSKANPDRVVGLEGLREARKLTRKPLVAIGGITLENARAVIDAGADSVAVIRALVGVPDVRQRAEEFLEQVESSDK